MTDEEYDEIANQYFMLGCLTGLKDGSGILLKDAAEAFAIGNDERAKLLRQYAEKLSTMSEEQREKYDEKYLKEKP